MGVCLTFRPVLPLEIPLLKMLGISGDGDSASIGMGHFRHVIHANVPMVYIIENNGVYGLTKGQFSATTDLGLQLKRQEVRTFCLR